MSARGYPRPQLQRPQWQSLDGPWDFSIDQQGVRHPEDVNWQGTIRVPFAPETRLSGISDTVRPFIS